MPYCQLCQSSQLQVYHSNIYDYLTGDIFSIFKCLKCGLGFTSPKPEDMQRYYPARYRKYNIIVLKLLRILYGFRVRSWIKNFKTPGTALEVGCGPGYILHALAQQQWKVIGIERSEDSAAYAKSAFNLPIIAGGLNSLNPGPHFDLIILFQVLEHLPDPLNTLKQCSALLKVGGKIIVGVPNFKSWQSIVCGRNWFHLDVPRHLFHFSPFSLRIALKSASFLPDKISFISFEHDPYGWIQSILNQLGFRQNLLTRTLMKLDTINAKSFVMIFTALIILPPTILLSLISWLAKKGALVEIHATKI